MIVFGVVLVVIGAAIAYLGRADRLVRVFGAVVAAAGLVLLLVGVLDVADAEHAARAMQDWARSSWGKSAAWLAGWSAAWLVGRG